MKVFFQVKMAKHKFNEGEDGLTCNEERKKYETYFMIEKHLEQFVRTTIMIN